MLSIMVHPALTAGEAAGPVPERAAQPSGQRRQRPTTCVPLGLTTISPWRNPGEDLEIAASEHRVKPTQTNTLTCTFDAIHR
jgi:hypothetical protein